jgi:outer membrane protein assembly factor BamD (BamD/ComL family)
MRLLRSMMFVSILAAAVAGPAHAGEPPEDNKIKLPTTEAEKKKLGRREITILRRQMKEREDTGAAAYKNAETAFLVGEYDKAIEEFLAVSREYEDTSFRMRSVLRVGDVYYRQRKYDRAVSYYQRSLKVPSELWWPEEAAEDYARGDYMIGVCYFDQAAMNRAFAHFRRFVQRHSGSKFVDRAFDFIGRGNMKMERYGQAIEAFRMVGTASLGKEARRTVSPGEELYVRVMDPDVGLATRHGVVPVLLKTTAGDVERLELKSLGLSSPVFLGTIKTRLGAPRLTRSLDEALSPKIKKILEDWLKAAEAMEEEATELDDELANLEDPGPAPEGTDEAAREAIKAHEKKVAAYEAEKARLNERIAALRTGADRLRKQSYAGLDGAFAKIERILDEWGVKEEVVQKKQEDQEPKEQASAEDIATGTDATKKGAGLSDVFTQEQIRDTRKAVREKPTVAGSCRFRRALLEYWHEQLLLEYKTLDLNGADTISVEYVDEHGNTEDGLQRSDNLGIASDATIVCVGQDLISLVSAVILGDKVRIKVVDPDMDMTAGIDTAEVVVASVAKITKTETKLEDAADDEKKDDKEEEEEGSVDVFSENVDEEEKMPELVPENALFIQMTLKETGPHTGIFAGEVPTIPNGDEIAAKLELSPSRIVRVAYSDKRTASHNGGWAVATTIEIVPGTTGSSDVIEMQESQLDRRSELEKGVALGKLARVYQALGLKLEAGRAFDEALKVVKKIVDAERGSNLGEEATYQMWDLYFASGDEQAAAEACSRLIAAFPNSPLADDALLIMGKAAEKNENYQQALGHYSRLVSCYPDSDLASEAQYRAADLQAKRGNFDVAAFETCANKYPDSNYAAQSLLKLSEYYVENRDYARARDYLERIALDFPDFDKLDKVTYMRGICAYRAGDIQLSYTLMHETIEKYPGTAVAKSAGKVVQLLTRKLEQK